MSVLGLIAGILGILGSGSLFVELMNQTTGSLTPIIFSLLALCLTITGLVGATLKDKNTLAGMLMLLGLLGGIFILTTSLSSSATPISFLIGVVTTILFTVGGIISLSKNKKTV